MPSIITFKLLWISIVELHLSLIKKLCAANMASIKNDREQVSDNPDEPNEELDHFRTRFHGSCSRCKHYHRHKTLDISKDESKHIRLYCEKCQHPMIGLGRASTQVTLASSDSIPTSSRHLFRFMAFTPCTNQSQPKSVASASDPRPNPSTPLAYSYGSSVHPDRPQYHFKDNLSGVQKERARSSQRGETQGVQVQQQQQQQRHANQQFSIRGVLFRIRTVGRRIKNKLKQRLRKSNGKKDEISSDMRPTVSIHRRRSEQAMTALDTQDLVSRQEVPVPDEKWLISSEHTSVPGEHTSVLGEQTSFLKEDIPKEERLRIFRHEKTLRRDSLAQGGCNCDDHCLCRSDPECADRGLTTTGSKQSLLSQNRVPDYIIGRGSRSSDSLFSRISSRSFHFLGVGQQFHRQGASDVGHHRSNNNETSDRSSDMAIFVGSKDARSASTSPGEGPSTMPTS